MASSKYAVRNLWNVAPFLATNLVHSGVVDASFNSTLAKAAVAAFDEYTSIRRGTSVSKVEAPSRTRRRKRASSTRQDSGIGSSATLLKAPSNFHEIHQDNKTLTDNDFFFEHQKTRGYRLASQAIADCECAERLQEDYIANAVAYYLGAVCGAKPLAELLLRGTGELSIDMWAAIQRGKGAYHADHVHEGALVSGVYYASIPSGSAPLVLRKPKANDTRIYNDNEEMADVLHAPVDGDLVLFPPWVEHGVPLVDEQEEHDSSLARVSFAFNVTGALALGNDPWNVTRIR